ncbi:hypothetical protein LTR37_009823 [Vermiconidia calcicola]|uniref:Uncharacterized protein n=1 Tax=Vermiconidia calcicola TaxID=1690605 RepID=A0ACC3N6R7_9PEZI|nr:hypothetical protein LTR37_009823 [Vermiconidia calcicola]
MYAASRLSVFVPAAMDSESKARLEQVRKCTPRYLFRAWNNTPNIGVRLSGGYEGLNTPSAITPLAFAAGYGHGRSCAYELTQEQFMDMVAAHLHECTYPETEFFSWAASPSFVVNYGQGLVEDPSTDDAHEILSNVHISIIDTHQLWETNQIFYLPKLYWSESGRCCYSEEYLAHGVIKGPGHRALPLASFSPTFCNIGGYTCFSDTVPFDDSFVKAARALARKYGSTFELPMTLACLSVIGERGTPIMRELKADDQRTIVLDAIEGLEMPYGWRHDPTIMTDIAYIEWCPDIEQFVLLMRNLAKHWASKKPQHSACASYADALQANRFASDNVGASSRSTEQGEGVRKTASRAEPAPNKSTLTDGVNKPGSKERKRPKQL